jgi:peptide/nickel transport system substrate-binding protein
LHGGSDSPQWLFSEPFFGARILDVTQLIDSSGALVDKSEGLKTTDPKVLAATCEKVKSLIIADDIAGTVTMKLAQAWSAFLPAMAHPAASIMDAKWVSENKGWDGSCSTWQKYYAPKNLESPFHKIANGTGPFKLIQFVDIQRRTQSVHINLYLSGRATILLERNDDYWRTPAKLEKIDVEFVWNGDTILSMMNSNAADGVWAQDGWRKRMEDFVGERCEYDPIANVYKPCKVVAEAKPYVYCHPGALDMSAPKCTAVDGAKSFVLFAGKPSNHQSVLLFNNNITGSYGNQFIGSAKLDGKGIPSDFFSDVHIRKAFAYCFNWDAFISDNYGGNAAQSTQLLLPGLIGFSPDIPHYKFDIAACEKEFKLADVNKNGIPASEDPNDVWQTGFQFKAIYTTSGLGGGGIDFTQNIAKILAKNINSINPKFKVIPTFVAADGYYTAQSNKQAPITIVPWYEDVHDPYNWVQPFITGIYGKMQSLPDNLKTKFQEIFSRGLAESDTVKRAEIYKEASLLYYDEAVGIPLVLTTDDYFWQRSVEGITLNPRFPQTYFYSISKK